MNAQAADRAQRKALYCEATAARTAREAARALARLDSARALGWASYEVSAYHNDLRLANEAATEAAQVAKAARKAAEQALSAYLAAKGGE